MNIQWYPGHMTKAKRAMQEDIKLIDLIIELVDARAPLSSRNPDIDVLGKGKARMILLNKADLALMIGISTGAMSSKFTGKTEFTLEEMEKIRTRLETLTDKKFTYDYLFERGE